MAEERERKRELERNEENGGIGRKRRGERGNYNE